MTRFHKLPPKFAASYKREMKLFQMIGIDIFDDMKRSVLEKYLRLILMGSTIVFLMLGAILYVVMRNEVGANLLEVPPKKVHSVLKDMRSFWNKKLPYLLDFSVITDLIKFFIVIRRKQEIRVCIEEITRLWPVDIEGEEKLEMVNIWSQRLELIDNVYYRCVQIIMISFGLIPLGITFYTWRTKVETEYQYLVESYFFHYLDSFYSYAPAYAFQLVSCIIIQMCIYMPTDVTLVGITLQLVTLFGFVQIDLKNIPGCANPHDVVFNSKNDCQEIKGIVKTHQRLLSLAERVNKTFGVIIFSQVTSSSIIICCYGFLAILKAGPLLIFDNLTASMGIMFSIFVLAWPGQALSDLSTGVGDAAYQSFWYEKSKKFRRYIAIIITRAQKPSLLSALGFSDITLLIFSKVLTTSWSYLSFLNQMSEDLDV